MQNVVIDKPYVFVPPHHGDFWPMLLRYYMPHYLARSHGVESQEFIHVERLKASIEAGHGIMLASNHCRPSDPMALGLMAATLSQPIYIMASWHLFMQGRTQAWLLPRLGVFSVYREGLDREAIKCAIDILVKGRRPLVIFPEGAISRTNDRLNHLMEGTAFIARAAAKQCAGLDPARKVVIHPVAIRYFFRGDIDRTLSPVLRDIEKRLSWQPRSGRLIVDRIVRVGDALLTLKELEHSEKPQSGTIAQRLSSLIDRLLAPIEAEWLKGRREGSVIARVKALRAAILPDMVAGEVSDEERARRWGELANITLAQQLSFYSPDYFSIPPTPEQLLETVERFEEDLTDSVTAHRPLHVAIDVGEAIEVSPVRERGVDVDPTMARLRSELDIMLAGLKERRPPPADRGGPR